MPPLALLAVVAVSVAGHGSPSPQPSHAAVAPSDPSDRPAAVAARGSTAPDPIDWASMNDERAMWSADHQESRRSHRLGAFANYRTDPYER